VVSITTAATTANFWPDF